MPFAIKQGYSLLSFDFSACGKSTGDIVTLGVREENDIEAAVDWA
jgi:alpha/beta superfamily hydrolase